MVLLGVVLVLSALVLAIYAVLEVLTTPGALVRRLPRALWVPVIVLLPLVGPLAWLLAGRPAPVAAGVGAPARRPGQGALAPDDDEAFLRGLARREDPGDETGRR